LNSPISEVAAQYPRPPVALDEFEQVQVDRVAQRGILLQSEGVEAWVELAIEHDQLSGIAPAYQVSKEYSVVHESVQPTFAHRLETGGRI